MIQARSVRLAAVVVLGGAVALATTACGGPMQAGAAAVVQGERTSDRQVQTQVAAFASLLEKNNLARESDFSDTTRAAIARAQVSQVVRTAVWQKAADDLGLTVGPDADAKERGVEISKARAAVNPDWHLSDNEAVAVNDARDSDSLAVAPSAVPAFIHYKALYSAVITDTAAKVNAPVSLDPRTMDPRLKQALIVVLDKASKEIDVKVSPRYGDYDPATGQVGVADTSWIHPTKEQLARAMSQMQMSAQ